MERFSDNPILSPIEGHVWESRAVFNPAAIYLEGKVHLLYRAMGNDGVSINSRMSVVLSSSMVSGSIFFSPGTRKCLTEKVDRFPVPFKDGPFEVDFDHPHLEMHGSSTKDPAWAMIPQESHFLRR